VFTARYEMSPYIKDKFFVFQGLTSFFLTDQQAECSVLTESLGQDLKFYSFLWSDIL
jgi:hypothetical protein